MSPVVAALAGTPIEAAWRDLPELDGRVDPFSYRGRMALFASLIASTGGGSRFGPDDAGNPFWGYVFQTHWQWATGRYGNAASDRIDPASLWCYGNYTLSVVPYLAAVRAGLAPDLEVLPPPEPTAVAYPAGGGRAGPLVVPPEMETALAGWEQFMTRVRAIEPGADLEPLRFALWEAHRESLEGLAPARTRLSSAYSATELAFFDGWVRMVDFLGAAAWRTDLEFMRANGVDVLPGRLLREEDVPGGIPDFPGPVNTNLASVLSLTGQSRRRFALSLWLWRRAMRTRAARDEVVEMLAAQFAPTPANAASRRRLLRYTLGF